MTSLPDPSKIPDHAWEFEKLSDDGLRRHYVYWIDKANGLGFRKTENLTEDALLAANRESFNDSYGKRFSDEPIGTKMASIPLNIFYRDFPQFLKDGDTDFIKNWLNRDENRPYRTFRGRV